MIRRLATVALFGLALTACSSALSMTDSSPYGADAAPSFVLPTADGAWAPPEGEYASDRPTGTGRVRIDGIGDFRFDASQVITQRSHIFQPGHFSVFDTLVHLADQGAISLDYHFDEAMDTHVIDAINGDKSAWWYVAYYSSGWPETIVHRMDMFPYKNVTTIRVFKLSPEKLQRIHESFRNEVQRLERNGGKVIIPELTIRSPRANHTFRDVEVTAHGVRSDALQPSVVTALDALLSLGERGDLPILKLTWYDRIGTADPVQHYFVERIGDSEAQGSCGFVYETGPAEFSGFGGSHIHIPSDLRVTVSPEYALWFWICL
jgi:hypothetical protein